MLLKTISDLYSKCAHDKDSGCIVWKGHTNKNGYGRVYWKEREKQYAVHRAAWELAVGPIPDGMLVCHTCDNPPCCNWGHLFVGDYKANSADMIEKGRQHRKLSDDDVREIRRIYRTHSLSTKKIASMFGISSPLVNSIAYGQAYAFVSGPSAITEDEYIWHNEARQYLNVDETHEMVRQFLEEHPSFDLPIYSNGEFTGKCFVYADAVKLQTELLERNAKTMSDVVWEDLNGGRYSALINGRVVTVDATEQRQEIQITYGSTVEASVTIHVQGYDWKRVAEAMASALRGP